MNRTTLAAWHERWLLTGIGERTQKTVIGLNWIGLSAIVSTLVCGMTTLLAARWMGPAQYGRANLALVSTYYIQIFFFLGMTTAVTHYVPQRETAERKSWTIDGLRLNSLFAIFTLIVGWIFRRSWAALFGVSSNDFQLALLWSGGNFLYLLATTQFIAQEYFKKRAVIEVFFALLYPLFITIAWRTQRLDGNAYVTSLALGYGVAGLFGLLPSLIQVFHIPMIWTRLKTMLNYGVAASAGALANLLTQTPALLIANHHLSIDQIGVLSCYQGGSTQVALLLLATMMQVVFPIASRTPDKQVLFAKIHRFFLLAMPLVFLSLMAALYLYFLVVGRHYPIALVPTIAFSLAAALTLQEGVLLWFLASIGKRGRWISSGIGLIGGAINVLGCFLWIPRYHITGAAAAMAASCAVGIFLCYFAWKAFLGTAQPLSLN